MTEDDTNQFGQEWQVKDEDPKMFQWQTAPQWPAQCILPVAAVPLAVGEEMDRGRHRLLEQVTLEQAEAACADWGDADREFCIADVVATNDLELTESGTYWLWGLKLGAANTTSSLSRVVKPAREGIDISGTWHLLSKLVY
jgi:hypothetical protein